MLAVFDLSIAMPDPVQGQSKWMDAIAPMKSGDYEAAATLIAAYLETQPTFAEGHTLLGVCRLKQGKLDLARLALTRGVELGDESFTPVQFLANIDLQQEQARSAIDRLSKFEPQRLDSSGRAMRAHLILTASDLERRSGNSRSAYDGAVVALTTTDLNTELRLLGESVAAGAALGAADQLADEAAMEWLEKGLAATTIHSQGDLEEHPALAARLLRSTGQLRQRLGQGARACADFDTALQLSASKGAAESSVSCYARLEDWPAARLAAERSLASLEGSAEPERQDAVQKIRGHLARACHHLDQYDEAIENYRLAGLEEDAAALESAVGARRAQDATEARCNHLRDEGERRLAETAWQPGSPEWMLLKAEIQKTLKGCDGLKLVHR
jgi:Tfp pilus assembly protein PilF